MNRGKLNQFAKVCRSKPINLSKCSRTQKPSKGKHRASLVDSKGPSDDEALKLLPKVIAVKNTPSLLVHRNPKEPNLSFRSRTHLPNRQPG